MKKIHLSVFRHTLFTVPVMDFGKKRDQLAMIAEFFQRRRDGDTQLLSDARRLFPHFRRLIIPIHILKLRHNFLETTQKERLREVFYRLRNAAYVIDRFVHKKLEEIRVYF